ncbi:hypothetical protein Q7A53_05115 [Halobacillus rhizosphaerae]|uniref:hypothetical protein n=1 Tax=Halobacillus rhizosphaerae TaxID=3064889 RepID=UPI00398AC777
MDKKQKKKRYYKQDEVVWVREDKTSAIVKSINKETHKATVIFNDGNEKELDLWAIDKLKFEAKKKLVKNEKTTYLASVNGGVIPTKKKENGGRDCYARLEPQVIDGKQVYELRIPQFTLARIPLGFASYLDIEDVLSLKHERSSIGSTGLIIVSGLIDSTYQGEVILQVVPLVADIVISSDVDEKYFDEKTNTYFVPYKKAIAQAVIFPQSQAEDVHVDYDKLLSKPSTRGTGGWGSTGK